jgi:hypothetical protein
MNPNSSLSPNAVKTALDTIFFPEFNKDRLPQFATAETASVFNPATADRAAVIAEIFEGSGLWEDKGEEEDIKGGTFKSKNPQTFTVGEMARSLDVPRTFAADAQFDLVNKGTKDMAMKGRVTRDNKAMAAYRGAFTVTKTNDGKTLSATDHPIKDAATVNNKLTSAFSESALFDGTVVMTEMKSQDNVIAGCVASVLLVPPKLFKLACEVTKSTLRSGTGNNDMNFYSDLYALEVRQSNFLGAAAGGSDTAWFLLGDNHSVTRWVREDIWTTVVGWEFQRNNNYIYKGGFREVVGAMDYVGVVGSDGSI